MPYVLIDRTVKHKVNLNFTCSSNQKQFFSGGQLNLLLSGANANVPEWSCARGDFCLFFKSNFTLSPPLFLFISTKIFSVNEKHFGLNYLTLMRHATRSHSEVVKYRHSVSDFDVRRQ